MTPCRSAATGRAARATSRRLAGFTLVELMTVCAVAAVLAAVAVPSYQQQLLKARRSDGIAALTKLQSAQDRLRSNQGLYSADLAQLQIAARSGEGLYALAVELTGPDAYRATATPLPGSTQARDADCAPLQLAVSQGFAQLGPSARCWNR